MVYEKRCERIHSRAAHKRNVKQAVTVERQTINDVSGRWMWVVCASRDR